jgi:hypothetical protein
MEWLKWGIFVPTHRGALIQQTTDQCVGLHRPERLTVWVTEMGNLVKYGGGGGTFCGRTEAGLLKCATKHRGRVVNTPASYSEVPGLNLCPSYQLSWLKFLWFSSIPPDECMDSTLKLGHDRFLPNPFQFNIIHSYITPSSMLYNLVTVKVSYNLPTYI